jgi:hypothetical protein
MHQRNPHKFSVGDLIENIENRSKERQSNDIRL